MYIGRKIRILLASFFVLFSIISSLDLHPAAVNADPAQPSTSDNKSDANHFNIIVILAEFPDEQHKVSRDVIEKRVFTDVKAYYQEVSYGIVKITGDVMADWIMMPETLKSYGEYLGYYKEESYKIASDIIDKADESIDFTQYNRVVIIIPEIAWNFALDEKFPTKDGVSLSWVTVQSEEASAGIIAHELGHTLGLIDLYDAWRAAMMGSSDFGSVNLGPWCLMSTVTGQHICGFNKVLLNWIPSERIVEVSASTRKWVSLEPLENLTNGVQIIKINRIIQDTNYQYSYNIEARRRTGFDDILPDEGILISSISESKNSRKENGPIYLPDSSIFLISPGSSLDASISGNTYFVYGRRSPPNTLAHATFNLGPGKTNIFKDRKQDLAIIVVNADKIAYDVLITTLEDADKIADYAMQLNSAKEKIIEIGSDNCSPETKELLALATAECEACIKNIRAESPVLDTEKLRKIEELTERASGSNEKYEEVRKQINKANIAIETAEKAGRYIGLDQAKTQLKKTGKLLDSYKYDTAIAYAVRARKSAEASLPVLTGLVNWAKSIFEADIKEGASFEVLSMDVAPAQVLVGQPVVVTARVINYGDSPGVFQAELIANDKRITWSKEQINAGAIASLPMTYMPENGKFDIDFAGMRQSLLIKRISNERTELKYDNDKLREAISFNPGPLIDFSPPLNSFTLKQVKIFALLDSKTAKDVENKEFNIMIVDNKLNVVESVPYKYSMFKQEGSWVTFNVPKIKMTDKFYIFLDLRDGAGALKVGADDSVVNTHSDLAYKSVFGGIQLSNSWTSRASDTYWYEDKSKVNWMIRVFGMADVPAD